MSSSAARVPGSGDDGWEVIVISDRVYARWTRLIRSVFVIRHLQQWFNVTGEALKRYRSEIRDRVSRGLGPGGSR